MENITALTLPEEGQFKKDIDAINRFQKIVHNTMIQGQDYGVIPGTSKPALLKPGAEKIAKLLGLSDQYEIVDKKEDWDKPLFHYLIKCKLVHLASGEIISEGIGECNSMESKYRWRDSKRKCPNCGMETITKGKTEYGGGWLCFPKKGGCGAKFEDGDPAIEQQKVGKIENDDIYSQINTILKMAKKRALVDAALSAGRLSEVFTQDVEDMIDYSETTTVKESTVSDSPKTAPDSCTELQRKKIFVSSKQMGYTEQQVKDLIAVKFGPGVTTKELTKKQASDLIEAIERGEGLEVEGN